MKDDSQSTAKRLLQLRESELAESIELKLKRMRRKGANFVLAQLDALRRDDGLKMAAGLKAEGYVPEVSGLKDKHRNLRVAVPVIELWRKHYNEVRPHSSLGNPTPAEYRRRHEPKPLEGPTAEASFH